jgi:hypothetical protein
MRCSVLDLGHDAFHVLVADLDGHRLTPRPARTGDAALARRTRPRCRTFDIDVDVIDPAVV